MSNIDADQGKALRETAQKWLDRIDRAGQLEKGWLDDAARAVASYTGEGRETETSTVDEGDRYDFNILFSNVETIVPAVLNSPPAPDVRRRFGSDDPVARDFAEMLERAMRVQIDDGRLQAEMEGMAQDAFLAGRGVIRIRFKGDLVGGETGRDELEARESADDPDARPAEASIAADAEMANERITFEAVSWRDYRHGPAKRWEDRPWDAFRHVLQPEDAEDFADATLVTAQSTGEAQDAEDDADRIVWEVWDRRSRTVIFIAERTKTVLKQVEDPLGLSGFFPIATPVQPIELTGRLKPVNPFSLYRRLADELEVTTRRIRVITKQLQVKGWYGMSPTDMAAILTADDNDFVPVSDPELWAQNGGMQAAIAFWPVEKLVLVLRELHAQREQTKQALYEVTGLSDIVRGASKSSETATAQNIKAQWGSLRVQKLQRMIERAARDLFLMMAEIIPTRFSPATLQRMTEIQLEPTEADLTPTPPPQADPNAPPEMAQQMAAQAQEAEQARQAKLQHLMQLQALMRERASSYYRIDVETDSTVRADLTRQKSEATEFMTASSGYFQAVGPLVQQGALPMDVATEIFASFSRLFNLGKSVEDALDELVTKAKEAAGQPSPEDPAKAAAAADAEARKAETAARVQVMQIDAAAKQQAMQLDGDRAMLDHDIKRADLAIRRTDLGIREADLALRRRELLTPPAPAAPAGAPANG